jgi:hypothetical protein
MQGCRTNDDDDTEPHLVLFINEVWSNLKGRVNLHNNRHLSSENPRVFHEVPLHDTKLGVESVQD